MDDSATPRLLDALAGRWAVVESTFPMWLDGKRSRPAFTYTRALRGGRAVLLDDVSYLQAGRERHIRGVDTPDARAPNAFVWRGSGMLAFVTSRWRVAHLGDTDRGTPTWAIVAFSRTLFTPAGLDVILRDDGPHAALDDDTRAHIRARAAAAPDLAPLVPMLRATT